MITENSQFIRHGRPMQNGFVERFSRSYREAVLDMYLFRSLEEVREQTELWIKGVFAGAQCGMDSVSMLWASTVYRPDVKWRLSLSQQDDLTSTDHKEIEALIMRLKPAAIGAFICDSRHWRELRLTLHMSPPRHTVD